MSKRFNAPNKSIYDFYNKIYIKCPKCGSCAVVVKKNKEKLGFEDKEILACSKCGYLKDGTLLYAREHCDLWLQVTCCGHKLWALNEEHLDYMESFVNAMLREQTQDDLGWHNQSLASRLPKWIKNSKNRKEVLKGISKLRDIIK